MSDIDLTTSAGRWRAYWSAYWQDHAYLRLLNNNNFHRLSPHAFRSAQPLPGHLRRQVPRHDIRTVVSLRGCRNETGELALERATCAELGVRFECLQMKSGQPPRVDHIERAVALLDDIEYPVLFHCKSGADRAGLMSALYLHLREGVPMAETDQLKLIPFLHMRHAKTGMLDHFLETYMAFAKQQPVDFMTWLREHYDRRALRESFRPWPVVDWFVSRVLRRE